VFLKHVVNKASTGDDDVLWIGPLTIRCCSRRINATDLQNVLQQSIHTCDFRVTANRSGAKQLAAARNAPHVLRSGVESQHADEGPATSPPLGIRNQSCRRPVMTNYISPLLFILLLVPGAPVAGRIAVTNSVAAMVLVAVRIIADLAIASAIRLAAEWERAVVFRFGKLLQVKGPGLFAIEPLIDQIRRIDTRVQTIQIARQQVITKDNVPVSIDAVLFFRVERASDAVIKVQDFRFAVSAFGTCGHRRKSRVLARSRFALIRADVARGSASDTPSGPTRPAMRSTSTR
jgi:hypothetical protein